MEVSRYDGKGKPVLDHLVVEGELSAGKILGGLLRISASEKTIAAGSLDVTDLSYVRVTGQGSVADDLDSLTGGVDGQLLFLIGRLSASVITVRDGSASGGNIWLAGGAARTLTRSATGQDILLLMYISLNSHWAEVSYSNN